MSWDDDNPNLYYNPEKFGLTTIDLLDDAGSYEFHTLIAWKHESGAVYWATDSGCSCPTPFDWATSLEKLDRLTPERWSEFVLLLDQWENPMSERQEFLRKVREALDASVSVAGAPPNG